METNVNVQNNDEVEIDLREILFVLLDKLLVILLVGVLTAGLASWDKIIYHTKVSVRNVNLCYE